jgi:hypothetical protein
MNKLIIQFCIIFFSTNIFAQKISISGYVKDAESGEALIGANIYDKNTYHSTVSNNYGYYSISFRSGDTVNLVFSYVGYVKQYKQLILSKDTVLNIRLKIGKTIEEIKITAKRTIPIEQRTQTSIVEIPMKNVKLMPQLMGESNLLKTIQMVPGVKRGNEGSSAIYVRGGSPDQNLILLDEVPLYYVSHYGGFFSIFNTDAISNVTLIKGGFPARYGGRLSSVIDVRMKEGNNQKFQGAATIGLMSSKVSFEGPVVKGKTSYILSLRRSFWDLFMSAYSYLDNKTAQGFSFYDINAKINHEFSAKDKVYLSIYNGSDNFYTKINDKKEFAYTFKNSTRWGNLASAFRWNHLYGSRMFSNFTFIYSKYRLAYGAKYDAENIFENSNFLSWIEDVGGKIDYEYNAPFNHKFRYGASAVYRTFNPGNFNYYTKDSTNYVIDTTYGSSKVFSTELAAYLEDEFKLGRRFSANTGIHFSQYLVHDEMFYSFEPRVSTNLQIAKTISVKASFVSMRQYIHLLSNSGVGMPTDLWVPATDFARPEQSFQVTFGLAKTFYKKQFELSAETYYKTMDNLIAYSEGTTFYTGKDWQKKIEIGGEGLSYGIELLVQKKTGKLTGWLGYTWSKTTRRFDNINFGKWYNFRYDRTHDASIVLNYKINKKLSLSASWVYSTGDALTLAQGKYGMVNNMDNPFIMSLDFSRQAHIYAGRNSFRGRSYHRLDLGLNYTKHKKAGNSVWSFSIYNAYNRMNPSYYIYDNNDINDNKLVMITEFPFLPSVSYSFVF